MRVTLMHNPASGDGRHDRDHLVSALSHAGHDVLYQSTKEIDWTEALDSPAELVVVAGGDGTVHKVFLEMSGRGTPATVLPLGSANNIARTLGIRDDHPSSLARRWRDGYRRLFDVGRLGAGEARFVESVGGGLFAELLARAEAAPEDPGGMERYAHGLRLLKAILDDARALRWTLALDGARVSGDFLALEVMNTRQVGPNILLAPAAEPGDGLLDVVAIGPEHREPLIAVIEARLAGRNVPIPALPVSRADSLEVRFPSGCALHIDDEVWSGPAASEDRTVRIATGAERVNLLVPR